MSILGNINSELKRVISGEFSEPITLVIGLISIPVDLIFDRAIVEVNADGSVVIGNFAQAMVHIDTIDAVLGYELTENDAATFTLHSRNYGVKSVERDDLGFARLELKRL